MRGRKRGRGTRSIALAGAMVLVAAGLTALATSPVSAATNANVLVNAGQSLATLPDVAIGMNMAVWDGRINDPVTSTLPRDASTQTGPDVVDRRGPAPAGRLPVPFIPTPKAVHT